MGLDGSELAHVIEPPPATGALPGIGGELRARPEDFEVREVPAYGPDGRDGHLLLTLRKRGLTTEDAVREVAAHCAIPRAEVGVAGLKDRDAVTEQWISVPAAARELLASFSHPAVVLGPPSAHGHKLRRGHLRGNRFEIVIRNLAVGVDEAVARTHAKLDALARVGGVDNVYGPQRFGPDGRNARAGIDAIVAGRRRRRGDLVLSAGQSALFNLYLLMRRERGLLRTVLEGDVLKKTDTGGLFTCGEPGVDQARLEAGELVVTGPMFGSKMRAPPAGTAAAALEDEVLAAAGVGRGALAGLGRSARGTRRPLWVAVEEAAVRDAPAVEDVGLEPGVKLVFTLPAGSYATVVCHEVQSGGETGD